MFRTILNISLVALLCIFIATGCGRDKSEEVQLDLPEDELDMLMNKGDTDEGLKGASSMYRGEWKSFPVYVDSGYFKNHFIPSGWMGDHGDMRFNGNWKENVHSRNSCIKIVYSAEARQGNGWSGMYWQNPENNWGMRKGGGFNLSQAVKLTFWARGEKGDEIIREFKMGGISGAYPDSDAASIGPLTLTAEWKQYTIDLTGMDLSYIIGGFCWVASAMDNMEGMVFYLDDIIYE
ncbi:MAG: hypothetical protein HQ575_06940 [Candidatus Omnitrophica bacterium]|nr:hypothetical protein [Candidatus Omnitrophota bacterium]